MLPKKAALREADFLGVKVHQAVPAVSSVAK
jgi:hypothetical protein